MFACPKQAEYGRLVPKTKMFANAKPTKRVKALFAAQVEEILWKYKLSPDTINLPARRGIQEIQIFEMTLKTETLAEEILHTIDKAIPSPIVYRLNFGGKTKFGAGFKRPSESDPSKNVIVSYFFSDWVSPTVPLPHMPRTLDLAALYDEMLSSLIPLARRPGESTAGLVERMVQIRAEVRECAHLEERLAKERQFNRKVEINANLRRHRMALSDLS